MVLDMRKRVVICGGRHISDTIDKWRRILDAEGYEIVGYPRLIQFSSDEELLKEYKKRHEEHYNDIKNADLLLALNVDRKGTKNYIGGGVFAEIAFAIGLNLVHGTNIEIYTVNPLPAGLAYSEELLMWARQGWIKQFPK